MQDVAILGEPSRDTWVTRMRFALRLKPGLEAGNFRACLREESVAFVRVRA